jgi:hypothetical protein
MTPEPVKPEDSEESAPHAEPIELETPADVKAETLLLERAIGGWRGIIDSGLPTAVFVVAYVVTSSNLRSSVIAAVAAGIVIVIWRLIRREPLMQVAAGFAGLAISAFFAARTDNAGNIYLPGMLTNLGYGTAFFVSILVTWPLLGIAMGYLTGEGTSWRQDRELRRIYAAASWIWVGLFYGRLIVQTPMYLAGAWAAGHRQDRHGVSAVPCRRVLHVPGARAGASAQARERRSSRRRTPRTRPPIRRDPAFAGLRLLIGRGHEQQFVARIERVVRGGREHPGAAHDGHEGGVGGPVLHSHALTHDGRVGGEGDLHKVGVALPEGEQADKVAHAHGLLHQRGQHARGRHGNVDAPGLVEHPLVLGMVHAGDHARHAVLGLGQQ